MWLRELIGAAGRGFSQAAWRVGQRGAVFGLAGWWWVGLAADSPTQGWRVYRAADGLRESLTTSLTLSPRGNLWVKHGEVDAISLLDGYTIRQVRAPGEGNYRVFESRAGRVWSVYGQGLLEWADEQWWRHPIQQVRQAQEFNPLRQIQPTPLLPAEQDRVLVLLPDQLAEYRALPRQFSTLRLSKDSGLGRFVDLAHAADGGVWLTGAKGLAKLPRPLRQLTTDTPWQEYLLPAELGLENLRRPFEDEDGGVTTVGESVLLQRRVLVHFDGTRWQMRALPGESLRFGWRGADRQQFWGLTYNALVRLWPDRTEVVREGLAASRYYDVAVQPGGAFWLATIEGLVRYSPLAWRLTQPPTTSLGAVHALLEDARGTLWAAGTLGLASLRDGTWTTYGWPEGFEASFGARGGLSLLADGRLVIGAAEQVILFDPAKGSFSPLEHPAGRRPSKVLGRSAEGDLYVLMEAGAPFREVYQVERYDGQTFRPCVESAPPADLGKEFLFLARAGAGDLWVGGSAGVAVWREGKWQPFRPADGYTDEGALCWLELDDGRIWCAGLGKILEFDGRRWTVVRAGFDRVSAMLRTADGSVWVATGSGLYRYYRGSWASVGEEEGLPSSSTLTLLEDRARRLWVGSARGLCQYFPRTDIDPPKTLLVRTERTPDDTGEDAVRVVFQGRDRWDSTRSDRLLFAHRLDEGQRSPFEAAGGVVLRHLAAGGHRLEVQAMDRNWNVEISPMSYEFSVVVPWYQETRIIAVTISGAVVALFFAALAINRHLQLRRSHARVERIVAERTHELEQAMQELAHSQKMRALGTLAAGIAHDFNNILSIIKGSAQIIERHLDEREKVLTRVARIQTVVDQGSAIVRAMLGFGRAADREPAAVNLRQVADDTIQLLGDRFLREVRITCDLSETLPPVRGVRDLIQQMLLNLILNGADALSEGGELALRAGRLTQPPPHVVLVPAPATEYVFLAVTDNGCGIDPAILNRVFEPFFTTKAFSAKRGTGLGLYMVYEFAKQMGYGLMVESVVGKGSTFTVFMPVEGASAHPPASDGDK